MAEHYLQSTALSQYDPVKVSIDRALIGWHQLLEGKIAEWVIKELS